MKDALERLGLNCPDQGPGTVLSVKDLAGVGVGFVFGNSARYANGTFSAKEIA